MSTFVEALDAFFNDESTDNSIAGVLHLKDTCIAIWRESNRGPYYYFNPLVKAGTTFTVIIIWLLLTMFLFYR